MRIIPEWKEYDFEIKQLLESSIKSNESIKNKKQKIEL